ncbi:MAG: FAD-dependent oxidoreductase [Nitrospinota bacterium]|nr:FAD-dependent oxidoreductase [Nitrospinota bacterium]
MTETNGTINSYVCTGCGIGESLDVPKLCKVPVEHSGLPEAKTHPSLCSDEGVAFLKQDVSAGANKIVIAACSKRVFSEKFDFGPSVMVERANIREGAVWISEPNNENTQLLAEDYFRMSVVKSGKRSLTTPYIQELDKKILVIGGGIAGLSSAIQASRAGKNVVLVEKESKLGGFMNRLKKKLPSGDDSLNPAETGISGKITSVENDPKIDVKLSTEIESISGQPGMFDVTMNSSGKSITIRVGAIIQATGSKPYDPQKLSHLGYGKKNIVTNIEFEDMAVKGEIVRPSDGGKIRSVLFVQCAGSRDEKHLPYCSSYCCSTTLKHAVYLREQDKDIKIYIVYKDIRTPGKYELFYKKVQEDDGIFFTKGEVASVEEGDGGSVNITVKETLLGGEITIKADMAVLATGMESSAKNGGALKLKYRQGPELPELAYGFPDSHFICFPYETRRTGIYATGTVRHPMDSRQAEIDSAGAVLKAIQCLELSSTGKSLHPRSGDTSYPEIAMDRCTQCKRCTDECPYGMYDEDEKANPIPNPLRCRRCGTCMGACPQKIISFKDYHVDMYSEIIRASSMPGEEEEKPRVLILACDNDSVPAFDMAAAERLKISPFVRIVALRCLGSMSMVWLSDAFSKGFDGVILMGCKHGDDYQCHNVKGSELANERMGKLEETLGRMAIEPQRVQFTPVAIGDYKKLPGIIDEFMKMIDEVGPNPFKEFGE